MPPPTSHILCARRAVVFLFFIQEFFGRDIIAAKGNKRKIEEQQGKQYDRTYYI